MNSRLFVFWALCFLFTFSSCKKNIVPVSTSAHVRLDKVTVLNLDFTYFNAKGRMQIEDEGEKLTSGITVRMRKDSIIWISVVPALGIEAARIRITQDSVHMLNRLKREFFAGDYPIIKEKYKVDLNYDLLQAILLGNYLPSNGNEEKILAENHFQHSRQEVANLLIDQFLDAEKFKLKKITIKDQETKNTISVDYSQFEQVGDKPFAKTALFVLQQGESEKVKGTIASIDYNKINLNEGSLAFPFSVPQGYKRQ